MATSTMAKWALLSAFISLMLGRTAVGRGQCNVVLSTQEYPQGFMRVTIETSLWDGSPGECIDTLRQDKVRNALGFSKLTWALPLRTRGKEIRSPRAWRGHCGQLDKLKAFWKTIMGASKEFDLIVKNDVVYIEFHDDELRKEMLTECQPKGGWGI